MVEGKKKSRAIVVISSILGTAAGLGLVGVIAWAGLEAQKQKQQRYEEGKEIVCVVPLQESYVSRLDMLTSQDVSSSRYGLRVRSDDSLQTEYDLMVLGEEKDELRARVQEIGLEHSLKLCFPRGNELSRVNHFAGAEGHTDTYLTKDAIPSVVYKLASRIQVRERRYGGRMQ